MSNRNVPPLITVLSAASILFIVFTAAVFTTGCKTLVTPTQVPGTVTNVVAGVTVVERVTNTVYVPNPAVIGGLDTARGVAGLVPPPYGNLVDVALVGATAVLGWIARRKTVEAASKHDQLGAVIAGVESADTTGVVKLAIAKEAAHADVSSELHKSVQDRT